jgi:hypothetical protein
MPMSVSLSMSVTLSCPAIRALRRIKSITKPSSRA